MPTTTTVEQQTAALKLHTVRTKLGLTQVEMAKLLDVSPFTISRWERAGHDIQHPTMLELALAQIAQQQLGRSAEKALESWGVVLPKI